MDKNNVVYLKDRIKDGQIFCSGCAYPIPDHTKRIISHYDTEPDMAPYNKILCVPCFISEVLNNAFLCEAELFDTEEFVSFLKMNGIISEE